jgi:hypothetical protein
MSTILLQRYANREIRIGCQSIHKAQKWAGDKSTEEITTKFANKVNDLFVSSQNARDGYELGYDRRGAAIAIPYTKAQHEALKLRLDIRSEFQQRSLKIRTKGGWGFDAKPTTFSKNARHRLLEAGAIMDEVCGKNICEVTCTIPGSTKEALRVVSQWSGWIMNRLTQIVRRCESVTAWFYVWELQKRGALHLHFAIGSSNSHDAKLLAQQIEFKWFELLLELKEKANVDAFAVSEKRTWRNTPSVWQSHVQFIRKSVAAYFSKYASKQSRAATRVTKGSCPARWWGSCSTIKRGIENARIKIAIDVFLPNVEDAMSFLRDVLSTGKPIKTYRYDFDLGTSSSGTILGGGWREIFYFHSEEFMQISDLMSALGDYVTQTWGAYADMTDPRTQISKITYKIGAQI